MEMYVEDDGIGEYVHFQFFDDEIAYADVSIADKEQEVSLMIKNDNDEVQLAALKLLLLLDPGCKPLIDYAIAAFPCVDWSKEQ